MFYTVTWTVDIDASCADEAATKALEMQRDPESIATVFEVRPFKEPPITVDLANCYPCRINSHFDCEQNDCQCRLCNPED